MASTFKSQPLNVEEFEFTHRQDSDGKVIRIIRSHVAYDARWPFWRRWIANLRGCP